jgi:acetyl esterase/lipase
VPSTIEVYGPAASAPPLAGPAPGKARTSRGHLPSPGRCSSALDLPKTQALTKLATLLAPPATSLERKAHRYGPNHGQVADLWLPRHRPGPLPVVVLVHGGFWRFRYTKRLMSGFAASIAARGLAAWNVEYRRLGMRGAGWPGTFDDVAAAVSHLAHLEGADLGRVVLCGHSAGGSLALWLASKNRPELSGGAQITPRIQGAVSLAGITDLSAGWHLNLGRGAVSHLLGGTPNQVPERYRACSPAELVPLGVPQVLVHGLADRVVPLSMSLRHCELAAAKGDKATFVPIEGASHLDLIDPSSPACTIVLERLEALLR